MAYLCLCWLDLLINQPISTHCRGDAFYADVNTLGLEEMHKDSEEAIDKMCNDLEKQYVISVCIIIDFM